MFSFFVRCPKHSDIIVSLLIIFLVSRPLIVTCAAIQATENPSLVVAASNQSTPLPQSEFSSTAPDVTFDRNRKCDSPYTWFNPLFQASDCDGALDWLFLEEMHMLQHQDYEFLSYSATQRTKLPSQQTPRKYTFRMSIRFFTLNLLFQIFDFH